MEKSWHEKLVFILTPAAACFFLPLVLLPFATSEAYSPKGGAAFEFLAGLVIALAFLTLLACFIFCFFGLLIPAWRSILLNVLLILFVSGLSLIGGGIAGGALCNRISTRAWTKLTERSKPLIAAINTYDQKFGHPPDSLEALVPEFIPNIPITGIGASPDYRYYSPTNVSYGKNKWHLEVSMPGFNFSTFMYLPLKDYSILDYGQIQKIGDWALWHRG